ncbi:MAG TPA: hypothetical protein PLC53_01465, partial [Bacilli bacterium]|nr:hypothetical protein [Bacilli bacterium]
IEVSYMCENGDFYNLNAWFQKGEEDLDLKFRGLDIYYCPEDVTKRYGSALFNFETLMSTRPKSKRILSNSNNSMNIEFLFNPSRIYEKLYPFLSRVLRKYRHYKKVA